MAEPGFKPGDNFRLYSDMSIPPIHANPLPALISKLWENSSASSELPLNSASQKSKLTKNLACQGNGPLWKRREDKKRSEEAWMLFSWKGKQTRGKDFQTGTCIRVIWSLVKTQIAWPYPWSLSFSLSEVGVWQFSFLRSSRLMLVLGPYSGNYCSRRIAFYSYLKEENNFKSFSNYPKVLPYCSGIKSI